MRLLIRADAGAKRGAGHVMRSLAVAEEAVASGWQVVLSADLSSLAWAKPWVDGLGIRQEPAVGDDVAALCRLARKQQADVVLLDHYNHPDAKEAIAAAGARLANFEDGAFGRRPSHLSIDYALGAERCANPSNGSGVVLRGVKYAPIRRDVRRARRNEVGRKPAARVAVLMGGTDATGLTQVVEAAISDIGIALLPLVKGRGHIDALCAADAVVSAAGVSSYELCCLGVPTGLLQAAENQSENYRAFTEAGAVVGLGRAEEARANPSHLAQRIRQWLNDGALLAETSAKASTLVDGLGASRIVAAMDDVSS